jgi:hypothetical protein
MFAKIFERKWVIRFFGLALIFAPFFNTASSVIELPGIERKFLVAYCWQFFKSAPAPQQLLQIASIIIGTLMLRGSITAWRYTLGLLGAYIILQFTQLNAGIRDNTTWLFLGTNVAMFFFIADQIVLKPRPKQTSPLAPAIPPEAKEQQPVEITHQQSFEVKQIPVEAVLQQQQVEANHLPVEAKSPQSEVVAPKAARPSVIEIATPNGSVFVAAQPAQSSQSAQSIQMSQPAQTPQLDNVRSITAHQSPKKLYVNFEGFGNWATMCDISDAGIKVRAIAPAPPEITSRTIELTLGALNLRLKFHQQDGAEYSFNFVALSTQDKQSLNQWLLATAA